MQFTLKMALAVCLLYFCAWTAAYGQITPSADAYTNTAQPSTNFGAKTILDVQSASQTAFIQFDLSSIPSGYGSGNLARATLKLYVNAVTSDGSFNVDFVNGGWAENKITADLSPALGTTIAGSVPLTSGNVHDYILIDVTSAVGAWLDGTHPNDGIALVGNSPLSASFDSKESTTHSHPPELDIVLTGKGQGTITGVNTPSGSGLTGGGNTGTLTLGLIKSCANNQILEWNGSSWVCSSAGTGTITGVTAGTGLTGGGTSGNITLNVDTSKIPQLTSPNLFTVNQVVAGSGLNMSLGDVGCGPPTWGIIAANRPSPCSNFILGYNDAQPGTYINRPSGGDIHFRESNGNDQMIIHTGGTVAVGSVGAQQGMLEVQAANGNTGGVFFGSNTSSFGADGVFADGGTGPSGDGNGGVFFSGCCSGGGDGVVAVGNALAGDFEGNVAVLDTLTAGAKNFKIDHPLDPANKYLVHASVESSEMKNIYDGIVTTDASGEAAVDLPEWIEALNADFRYQLTVIGEFAQAIVAHEIQNHQFQIKTSAPNVKVSWQITGVRQDAYAKAHPLIVEEEKETRLRGYYLHPELYGAPDEKQIEWARHPQTMKRLKALREKGTKRTESSAPGALGAR